MSVREKGILNIDNEFARIGAIHLSISRGQELLDNYQAAVRLLEETARELFEHQYPDHFGIGLYGSAIITEDDREYKLGRRIAKELVLALNSNIITGGGPGFMEAGHRGLDDAYVEAKDKDIPLTAKNIGVGININQPDSNSEAQRSMHEEVFTRVLEFVIMSHGAYLGPGGIGTLHELTSFWQTKQLGHLEPNYLVLAHSNWKPGYENYKEQMFKKRQREGVDPFAPSKDFEIFGFTDEPEEVVARFKERVDYWNEKYHSKVIYHD